MKNLLIIAFVAAAFVACSKDDNGGGKNSKVPQQKEPYILYYDADSKTLAAGQWGTINTGNMLYFKFGSVVGFTTIRANDSWDAQDIKFDPTETGYPDYTNIPFFKEAEQTDGFISSGIYHYGANVKDGLGDPCKLVGLKANATATEIDNHDSGLRLPTQEEFAEMYPDQQTFLFTSKPVMGRWLASDKTVGTFLPFLYLRDGTGAAFMLFAGYWSSKPTYSPVPNQPDMVSVSGYALSFDNDELINDYLVSPVAGLPVRCVRDL